MAMGHTYSHQLPMALTGIGAAPTTERHARTHTHRHTSQDKVGIAALHHLVDAALRGVGLLGRDEDHIDGRGQLGLQLRNLPGSGARARERFR